MNDGPDHKRSAQDEWRRFLVSGMEDLREKDLLRNTAFIQGIDFISNDYLSLNHSGKLFSFLTDQIASWQDTVGSTGSRLLQGHRDVFDAAEEDFGKFAGFESSLLLQSGYSANTGVIPALVSKNDIAVSDKNCHASMIDGIRLSGAKNIRFRHNDLSHLEEILKKTRESHTGRIWIFSETLFSMDGDMPDLPKLTELSEQYDGLLYLDEAHAAGVFGPEGSGLIAEHNLQKRIAVSVFPMGKAPGLAGAFVCGNAPLKEYLINTCRSFIFSTAQPPLLAALLRDIIIYLSSDEAEAERKKLLSNAFSLRNRLKENNIPSGTSVSQIVPVICGEEKKAVDLACFLQEAGFAARAVRPPSVPRGSSRLRLAVKSLHTEKEILQICDTAAHFFQNRK